VDLIDFIPGINTSAPFSPGPTTPAPFNVNHIGGTDGANPNNATFNVSEIYNRLLLQVASTIAYSGLTIDNDNWAQLPYAVQQIATNVVNSALGAGFVTTSTYNADFASVLSGNGWARFKGGLILQWGATSTPVGSFPAFFTTTFPLAFPNNVFQIYGTMQNMANLVTSQNIHETEARLSSKTLTTATWLHDFIGDTGFGSAGTQYPQVYWFAIGN